MEKKIFLVYAPPIIDYMPEAYAILRKQKKNFSVLDMLENGGSGFDPREELRRCGTDSGPKIRMLPLDYIASILQNALEHHDEYRVEVVNGAYESLEACIQKHDGIQSIKAFFCSSISASFPEMLRILHVVASRKIPCIAGGIHLTARPNDLKTYLSPYLSDGVAPIALVKGPCNELLMQKIIQDLLHHSLQEEYSLSSDMLKIGYWPRNTFSYKGNHMLRALEIIRGCPYDCPFCSFSVIPKELRKVEIREPNDVIAEIINTWKLDKPLQRRLRYVISENIFTQRQHFKRLLVKILEECPPINFLTQADCLVCLDEEFLRTLKDAGCLTLLVGFESLSAKNLEAINKKSTFLLMKRLGVSQVKQAYVEAIKRIQHRGISVTGAFMLGLPFDEPGCGDELGDFYNDYNVLPHTTVVTALPGATYFEEQYKEHLIYKHPDEWDEGQSPYPAAFSGMDFTEANLYFPTGLSPLQVHEEMHAALSQLKGHVLKTALQAFKNSFHAQDRTHRRRSWAHSFLAMATAYEGSKALIALEEKMNVGTTFRMGLLKRQTGITQHVLGIKH